MTATIAEVITPEIENAKQTRQEKYEALLEKYGNYTNIPFDETFLINEELRALYCFNASPNLSKIEALKHYSIDRRIWNLFIEGITEDHLAISKKPKRTDKYDSIIEWTEEHLFEQITPQTIMEVGEISYPTAIKFINDRPDIFRKVKRGLYEVRDPKADRKAEKR